jgi:murein DD-endopeptidase MepM/ murein hydrolase activator NlpD
MELELWYPVHQSINQTNLFGANSALYANLGQNGHPGLDFEAPSGTPLLSPVEGDAFYVKDSLGGDGLWIRTPSNSNIQYTVILWHMYPKGTPNFEFTIPTDGSLTHVTVGQLLGYTDNSGYSPIPAESESTGPHLHVGVMPCDKTGAALEPHNGFLGCVDPAPFFNGKFAEEYVPLEEALAATRVVVSQIANSSGTHAQKLDLLAQIRAFISGLHL